MANQWFHSLGEPVIPEIKLHLNQAMVPTKVVVQMVEPSETLEQMIQYWTETIVLSVGALL